MSNHAEGQLAEDMRAEILAIVKKYEKHEHLSTFASDLEAVADELGACIEDTEDVE